MPPDQGHVAATIVRNTTNERGAFAIRDLSPGGARLVGQAFDLFEGEALRIAIELDEPIELDAEVVNVDRQRKVIEVQFRNVTEDALAQIERSIADMLGRVRAAAPATVLVVHPSTDVSNALERDLARVGVAARAIATLAEIDEQLDDKPVRFIGVIIAGSFGEAVGPALQALEDHHADLKRVLLFGDQIDKLAHPATNRVHAVLRTPWRFKGLARALEVSLDEVVTTYDQLVALQVPKK